MAVLVRNFRKYRSMPSRVTKTPVCAFWAVFCPNFSLVLLFFFSNSSLLFFFSLYVHLHRHFSARCWHCILFYTSIHLLSHLLIFSVSVFVLYFIFIFCTCSRSVLLPYLSLFFIAAGNHDGTSIGINNRNNRSSTGTAGWSASTVDDDRNNSVDGTGHGKSDNSQ